ERQRPPRDDRRARALRHSRRGAARDDRGDRPPGVAARADRPHRFHGQDERTRERADAAAPRDGSAGRRHRALARAVGPPTAGVNKMKRTGLLIAGICVTLAAPLGAHWNNAPGTDSPPDPQRQRPTVVNEPDGQRVTIALSDPSKPGTLQMDIVMGSVTVKAVNRKDVLIEAHAVRSMPRRNGNDEPPPAGLRRLTQSTPFEVEEDKNTISIDVENPTRAMEFTIEV